MLASAHTLLIEHDALAASVRASQRRRQRWVLSLHSPPALLSQLPEIQPSQTPSGRRDDIQEARLPPSPRLSKVDRWAGAKSARVERYRNYVPEEETIRNDYSQHYVDSGEWPQNFVLGAEPERRFEECALTGHFCRLLMRLQISEATTPACLEDAGGG